MYAKPYLRRTVLLISGLILCYGLVACRGFKDATSQSNPQVLAVPVGAYAWAAWLDADRIAFLYGQDRDILAAALDSHLLVYSFATGELSEIADPAVPEGCAAGWVQGWLERLPDGNLGFIYRCSIEPIGNKYTLFGWDTQTGAVEILHTYPSPFPATFYSFAPDMSELIQEAAVGAWLENELYHVGAGTQLTPVLDHFQRAMSPSWSPDGTRIAFFGTEHYPGGDSNEFSQWGQIEDLLLYPWDLYVMSPDTDDLRILIPRIEDPFLVKWAPAGNRLAFMGDYKGVPGVWLLTLDTMQLTRLWPERALFDWSPDGTRMVILDPEEHDEELRAHPAIIDVPHDDP